MALDQGTPGFLCVDAGSDAAFLGEDSFRRLPVDDRTASAINIDSANGVVTLTGTVRSEDERTRAVQLARETAGVTSVRDRLVVR